MFQNKLFFSFLILFCLLNACTTKQYSHNEQEPIKILERLPSGIACESIDQITMREGTGCGNMGGSKPAQIQFLYYNLRQKAKQLHANVIVPVGEPMTISFQGCPSFGLTLEAKLYRCQFANQPSN